MKKNILELYRNILKTGQGFKDYNFRTYIIRRAKEVRILYFNYYIKIGFSPL